MTTDARWRFVGSDDGDDGTLWLERPTQMTGYIDFQEFSNQPYQRVMVATHAFVARNVAAVHEDGSTVVFPAMLVVPDGPPAQIRASIERAVKRGGLAHFCGTSDRSSS